MDIYLNNCQACLSGDRRLYPVRHLQDIIQNSGISELASLRGGLCWECRHRAHQVVLFRQRIRQAQQVLQCSPKTVFCLSKLVKTTVCDSEYTFPYDPLEETETCIKNQELEDEKYSVHTSQTDTNNFEIAKVKEEIEDENLENTEDIWFKVDPIDNEAVTTKKEIFVQNLEKKERKKTYTAKSKKIPKGSEKEENDRFLLVVYTEEEILQLREEKRNHYNYKKIPYKCDSCVLGFVKKSSYDYHMETKHAESIGPHACPVCSIRFADKTAAESHHAKHFTCYRCRLCDYETQRLWFAHTHARKHTGDGGHSVHCLYCKFVAKTQDEISQHMAATHVFQCDECKNKFKSLDSLRTHIRRIHKIKRDLFICDVCSKAFHTKSRLESHMSTHSTELAMKLAYCATCRVQYKNIYIYRSHLRNSANHAQNTYQCKECNKSFASKTYWKIHYNFYHLRKSKFHCEICNKLFISDFKLKSHRQKYHGMTRPRDHRCNVCGKQFFTAGMLRNHQLTHSSQRSFMCADCGDTFKQRPALYTHTRLVHTHTHTHHKHKRTKKVVAH